jgi:hypothetical protein
MRMTMCAKKTRTTKKAVHKTVDLARLADIGKPVTRPVDLARLADRLGEPVTKTVKLYGDPDYGKPTHTVRLVQNEPPKVIPVLTVVR